MRIGLEPIGQNTDPSTIPLLGRRTPTEVDAVSIPTPANIAKISPITNSNNSQNPSVNLNGQINQSFNLVSTQAASSQINLVNDNSTPVNYVKSEVREAPREQTQTIPSNHIIFANPIMTNANAPTDLSLKRPVFPHKLNLSEIAAVKQLITGYRESAAFLLRSADELDQLLLQQQ